MRWGVPRHRKRVLWWPWACERGCAGVSPCGPKQGRIEVAAWSGVTRPVRDAWVLALGDGLMRANPRPSLCKGGLEVASTLESLQPCSGALGPLMFYAFVLAPPDTLEQRTPSLLKSLLATLPLPLFSCLCPHCHYCTLHHRLASKEGTWLPHCWLYGRINRRGGRDGTSVWTRW